MWGYRTSDFNNELFQGIANKELSQMDIYTSVVPKRLEIQSEAAF